MQAGQRVAHATFNAADTITCGSAWDAGGFDRLADCLTRRIDNMEELRRQVRTWEKCRNQAQAKVNWQFTTADARIELRRLYPSIEE